ncbi:CRAL-TRIO domain-containing protein [Mrakia frigida]|uniref:CRAL-TRIO domain-containing protein n=1 Tax=Mrakia frigida TaxID=29902 RepID=UPI003FCBFEF9
MLSSPSSSSKPIRPAADLNSLLSFEERSQLDLVLDHFLDKGCIEETEGGLSEGERFWMTRECIIRYLKGSKWHSSQAITRIEATLAWRREVGVDDITAESVEPEAVCGKAVVLGFSTSAEPLFYITPSKRDTEPSDRQFKHIVWIWERCGDLMGPGVESVVVLLNCDKRPSASLSSKVRIILQMMTHHYPYRVGAAHVQNTPFVLNAFLSLVWPFIDPQTKSKVDMKGKVVELGHVERETLMAEFGGDLEFEYKHDEYYPYLAQLAASKRADAMQRWRSLGGSVGISEWDVKTWEDEEEPTSSSMRDDGDLKTMIREEMLEQTRIPVVDCIY